MFGQAISLYAQRRRSLRRAVRFEARVTSAFWDEAVSLGVTDLSQHGLWLASPLPLSVGDRLQLSFAAPRVPSGRIIDAEAKVVRVSLAPRCDACGVGPGMGVAFTKIAVRAQLELARELRGLPPPLRAASVCNCAAEDSGIYKRFFKAARLAPAQRQLGLMTRILAHARVSA